MANGLSKIIKKARKASDANVLARFAKKRFQVEELEDRIAPAVTAHGTTGSNGAGVYTLNASDDYVEFTDGNGETWEIGMLQSGGTGGTVTLTFNADNGTTLTGVDLGATALDGTSVKLVVGQADGTAANDLSLGAISDTAAPNTASGISIYGVADVDFSDGITDTADATVSAMIDATTVNLDGSDIDVISIDAASGTMTINTLNSGGSITAATSLAAVTIADTMAGDITSAGTIGTLTVTTGNASGDISAAGSITEVVIDNGNLSGAVTTTNSGNLALNVDGDISGDITVAGTLSAFDADGDISSDISAAVISNGGFDNLTSTGSITSAGSIGTVTADSGIAGDIDAGTTITGVVITSGDLDGDVTAAGSITTVNVDNGDMAGTVTTTNSGSITTFNVDGDISGNITVAGTITTIDADGDVSSDISAAVITTGGFDNLTSTGSITTTGLIDTITADSGIAGSISSGSTVAEITITSGNLTGSVTSAGTVTLLNVDNGNLTGTVTTTGTANLATLNVDGDISGNVTVAGTLTSFDADGDISSAIDAAVIGNGGFSDLTATGTIESAAGIGTLTADDGIAGGITAATTITGVVVTAGNLAGSVSAGGDVTAVTVDDGNLSGTITTTGTANLVTLNVDGDISGDVTVAGTLGGTLFDADGDISSTVRANAVGAAGFDNLTATGSIASTTTLAAITADTAIAGSITSGGNATGAISATDISGTVSIGGNLTAGVSASAGSISDLTVAGVITPAADASISATTGSVTLTAGAIKTANDKDLIISATDDVTVVVNGTDYTGGTVDGAINADNGDITITADNGDADDSDDAGNGGDLVVVANNIFDADLGVDELVFNGDSITLAMNVRASAEDTDANIFTSANADAALSINNATVSSETYTSVTGTLECDVLDVDDGSIAAISVSSDLTVNTSITAADAGSDGTNSIGSITSGGDLDIAAITADENVGAVSATGSIAAGTWAATNGSFGAISAGDADNDGETIGVLAVTAGTSLGNISATGDIANGSVFTSGAMTVSSNVLFSVTDNDIVYTIESDNATTDIFDVVFTTAATNRVAIDVQAVTENLNIRLASDATDATVDDTQFDLASLDVLTDVSGSTAAVADLGTLTVEGNTLAALTFATGSAVDAIIVQDNIGGTITVGTLGMVSAASVGGAQATVANLDGITTKGVGEPSAVELTGDYDIPVNDAAALLNTVIVYYTDATEADTTDNTFDTVNLSSLTLGYADDSEVTVSLSSGDFAGLDGAAGGLTLTGNISTDQDFSNITGAVAITGDVATDATLTLGALTSLTLTGDVAGTVEVGNVAGALAIGDISGSIEIGTVGAGATLGDMSGTAVIGNITGALAAGDISGSLTTGNISVASTIGSVGDAGSVTVGNFTTSLTVTNDMAGSLVVGDSAGDVIIGGDVNSFIQVGTVGSLLVAGDLGSASGTSLVVGEHIDVISAGDTNANGVADVAADIYAAIYLTGAAGGAGTVTIDVSMGYVQAPVYLGADQGVSDVTVVTSDSDGGTASHNLDVPDQTYVAFGATSFASGTTGTFDTVIITDDDTNPATDIGEDVATSDTVDNESTNIGNLISSDGFAGDITIEGSLTGTFTVDNDAEVSAYFDMDTVVTGLATGLTGVEATGAAAYATSLADVYSLVQESFEDENGVDALKDYSDQYASINGADVDITALSFGNIVVEGNADFGTGTISITAGSLGNITVGGAFTATGIADVSGIRIAYHANAALGTIMTGVDGDIADSANEGDITADIVLENGNFGGMIARWGGYAGEIQILNGTTTTMLLAEDSAAELSGATDVFADPTGLSNIDYPGQFAYAGSDLLIEDVISMSVTGSTAIAVYSGTDITVLGDAETATFAELTAGTLDDVAFLNAIADTDPAATEVVVTGSVGTFTIVEGDLAGDVDVSSSVDNLEILEGNLSGSFEIDGDMTRLVIDGAWTGSVTLNPVADDLGAGGVVAAGAEGEVGTIVVSGSVLNANLNGTFDPANATDMNGDALEHQPLIVSSGEVLALSSTGDNDQYVYLAGRGVQADISVLFGQVTGLELTGKGAARLVSVESDTELTARDMARSARYGQLMIRGRELANDYIDFDEPGAANLPDITISPRVALVGLTVDGSVGNVTDLNSNIKNVFVSGTAGNVFAGGGVVNGYFGNVGDITGTVVGRINVEGNAGAMTATRLVAVDVEGDLYAAKATAINGLFVGGNVGDGGGGTTDDTLSAAKMNRVFVNGDVETLQGMMIANTTIGGTVTNLNVQQNYRNRPSLIKNTFVNEVTNSNIDFDVDNAIGFDGTAVVDLNGGYNPVKIINSFVGL